MNTEFQLRPSPIAGTWYSANPKTLGTQIDDFLVRAEIPAIPGKVIALISPHAGYRYSGRTAAFAYKTVQGKSFDIVVVVSPLHGYVPAAILTSAHSGYQTPLGEVLLEQSLLTEFADLLTEKYQLRLTRIADDDEHSLEIQLPFLQRALEGGFKLLPLMLRSKEDDVLRALGLSLGQVLQGKNALLVASTDLSHFYSLEEANKLDESILAQIASLSAEGVMKAENRGSGFACGAPAVAVVLHAARALGADTVTILNHSTSGEVTGDNSSVVGYGAAAIFKKDLG
jgi:AmmeMemoRadiSam system protein B